MTDVAKKNLSDMKERQILYHFVLGRNDQGWQVVNALPNKNDYLRRLKIVDGALESCNRFK
jgi:hypothetical protein